MRRTEKVELTTLCLIYQNNKILLQNRTSKKWHGYALPGGHVEKGESIIDSVIREMKEETGLSIKHPHLCGIKQFPIENRRYLVFLFKTDEFEGYLQSSEEGEVLWIDRDCISDYQTVDDFEELLSVFEKEDLTEFIYEVENDNWNVILK